MSKTADTYRMIIDQIKSQILVTIVSGVRSKQFKFDESEAERLNTVLASVIDSEGASGFEKISNSFRDDLKLKVEEATAKKKKK